MKIFNLKGNVIVSEIDHRKLHRFILQFISTEFSNMVENCYYPKVNQIYKTLLHMTNSKEKNLNQYSKEKYPGKDYLLLHDPYTTLLVLIIQEFLNNKDIAAAESAFHLFALRYYRNILYKMTTKRGTSNTICNPDYFQAALENISKNHIFNKKKTIPNSIMYFSREIFKRYLKALKDDNSDEIVKMIQVTRHRIMQSMKGFFKHYYQAAEEKKHTKVKDVVDYDRSHEKKIRTFIHRIVQDMCIYGKVNNNAITAASRLIKFNQKLSVDYAKKLSTPMFFKEIETALFLLIKDVSDVSAVKTNQFLEYVKKLLSIKITKKQIYFKGVVSDINDKIIKELNLEDWYNKLTIQSKAISRNYIAYYLVFYIRSYL